MISLRLFLLVLVTLACRELAGEVPLVLPLAATISAIAFSLGFGLLLKAAAIRLLASTGHRCMSGQVHAQACWQRFSHWRSCVETAWVMALPAALLATGWGQCLNAFQLAGLPVSVALLGWFLPSFMLIALIEMTAAQFDDYCRVQLAAHATASAPDAGAPDRGCWADWKMRMRLGDTASLLTCIVPVFLIAALTDLARSILGEALSPPAVLVATFVALAIIVLALPWWLARWMGVVPFPAGHLREHINELTVKLRMRAIEPMWVASEGRWPGAAIVGWLPRFRKLWIGDALVEQLSSRQLDMVIMHELAHVARKHFMWRMMPIAWAVALVALILTVWPLNEHNAHARTLVSSLLASSVLLVGIGWMAHRCELDADRAACTLAETALTWARENPGSAAREMSTALQTLLSHSPKSSRATWLHPSLAGRLRNL